ncbi:MAG: hypothetical protein QNK20_03835 [Aureibaculum sp.]|nr:hypothetical protein [Aureibaculum sp.]
MKIQLKLSSLFIVLLGIFLFCTAFQNIYSQDAKKNKIRLKADYVKVVNNEVYLDIKASSKIDKKNVDVANIEVIISNEFDDQEIELGTVTTNMNGESRFVIKDFNTLKPDSTNTFNIALSFKGNDKFKRASKSISFKDAVIEAELITKDSINYITATLMDSYTDSVIVGETLNVQLQRLFMPFKIGEDFYSTDENGTIVVPIEEGMPGVDGILTFEVVLSDSDDYGTVKALVKTPIGIPIVDESTFDERTMWSPRNKTPLFLLILPNILTFGIWIIIIYLIINLFKIFKTKTKTNIYLKQKP